VKLAKSVCVWLEDCVTSSGANRSTHTDTQPLEEAAHSMSFHLYKDALQAIFTLLPFAELFALRSVSHFWLATARTEYQARRVKDAFLRRQITSDVENLDDLTTMLMDPSQALDAVTRYRRLLSVHDSPHNEVVVQQQGVVVQFVKLMQHQDAKIQLEAVWCQ
jgi:hypothetical protein